MLTELEELRLCHPLQSLNSKIFDLSISIIAVIAIYGGTMPYCESIPVCAGSDGHLCLNLNVVVAR